MLDLRH